MCVRALTCLSSIDLTLHPFAQGSTYFQFFAGDFAMERCTLEIRIPPPGDEPESGPILSAASVPVQVWRVKAPRTLNISDISWASRPDRDGLLGAWALKYNQTVVSDEFIYPSLTFQTVEMACEPGAENCLVQFTQVRKRQNLGAYSVFRAVRVELNHVIGG